MTYRIALVEDDPLDAETTRIYFDRFAQETGLKFDLSWFPSGEQFLAVPGLEFDLVFMDICLPGMDGMETARRLRETGSAMLLVFVTNMANMVINGYEVEAFDFILKPVGYPSFTLKMTRILKKLTQRQDKRLTISRDGGVSHIQVSDIQYIEVSGHDLMVHTVNGKLEAYGSLNKMEEKINSPAFVRCNSCYLVNLRYVMRIEGNTVTVGQDVLKISRPKKTAFVQAVNRYLGGGRA